jgi:hypothetical protein
LSLALELLLGPRVTLHHQENAVSEEDSPNKYIFVTRNEVSHQASYDHPSEEDALSEEDSRTLATVASTRRMSDYQASYENHPECALEKSSTKEHGGGKKLSPLPSLGSDNFADDDDVDQCTVMQRQYLDGKLRVISNVVFVASAIYVAMEATYLPYYQFYKDVPYYVREAENDDVWWTYYNETDAFPDYLSNTTDENAWSEWFNNSFLDEEEELGEFLFQVPNADRKYEVRLTHCQF